MATKSFMVMQKEGPEDYVYTYKVPNTSSQVTAGPDFAVGFRESIKQFSQHDIAEYNRFKDIAGNDGPAGQILRDMVDARNVCAKTSFNFYLCSKSVLPHQIKQCADAMNSHFGCLVKATRAVDTLCRKPFYDYVACMDKPGASIKTCIKEHTAFDVCTEDF